MTRGIHAEEFEGIDQLDPASVKELFGHPPPRADAGADAGRNENARHGPGTVQASLARSGCAYAVAMSGKTASILVFSVAALNGLTM